MPGKTEQVLFCRLSPRQRSLYEAYIQSDEVRNVLKGSPQLLKSITILRKICNHPDLVCSPDDDSFNLFVRNPEVQNSESDKDDRSVDEHQSLVDRAGKLEVLAKILPLWRTQGHRVLIFCQWKMMLNIIERFTRIQGWKFLRMDGNTTVGSRQRLVDDFNNDESYFGMLMTTRTGGVGLNLTGANRIILYDPDWNPQTDAQARERAWRFGQKRAVTVYRLISAGTIEEKIYQRQIFKTALTNKVLQDPRQRRLFSQRDLVDFFTLQADDERTTRGGHGVTQLGEITRGEGVVDLTARQKEVLSDQDDDDDDDDDDDETLETVLKSQGLAGVFDHDFVESGSSVKKSSTVREMEERAKSVAEEAARALQKSVQNTGYFEPTWTGSTVTKSSRFGRSKIPQSHIPESAAGTASDTRFGSASSAGVVRDSSVVGSKHLLAGLARTSGVSQTTTQSAQSSIRKYTVLLGRIKKYIKESGGDRKGGGPTTDDILSEFDSVPNCDAAIFRRLLNSVARVERGKWRLK
eukprot:CAMPEP_0116849804 /NCGR_PEP_ID=MMETSP0418-20121206/15803_1 /TAXON_ID=1158023 /ORGANISM="Astrosyne radiata, Strain 13vi08-1A" /LENGTH=521 /DNA_ID=CAMNT_0004481621 /DNA_START=27 /DNA_END=1592 /DNA_ORIENTATION=+